MKKNKVNEILVRLSGKNRDAKGSAGGKKSRRARKGARKEVRERSRVAVIEVVVVAAIVPVASSVLSDMLYKFGIRDDFSSNRVRRIGGFSIASGNRAYFTVK